eukprot:CAMPEP_0176018060 /NCGR_PEP_ID=MMETSP0120_2-20121206/8682_1 /TAXON_ID=160619 /ORGANISM="Kryptoperidinium foliaceum, Strain CCMP 1326" /LENGTH=65 /DNA_ID=CAMNT_0017351097 /DNA_START=460 /DNA_END=657 /DNA_ORIENTATION=+
MIKMPFNCCMHAQQSVESKEVKRSGYQGVKSEIFAMLPPRQQAMVQQGKPSGMEAPSEAPIAAKP